MVEREISDEIKIRSEGYSVFAQGPTLHTFEHNGEIIGTCKFGNVLLHKGYRHEIEPLGDGTENKRLRIWVEIDDDPILPEA